MLNFPLLWYLGCWSVVDGIGADLHTNDQEMRTAVLHEIL